ncbi:endonuclease/exonuclease/phosphatase family protein [Streptomyces sp. NBC_01220]|uniref:endonuclease/exonuclease/phosphatase family protein n=1 Tax=unclassified Streptomyces TaxID=2593676 RepID=UPI003431FC35|nr:endonuclease/exonuclease/phosphatase family protein [Streptomyces sp. NBC_01220]
MSPPGHEPAAVLRRAPLWAAALLLTGVSVVIGFRAAGADGTTPVPQALAFLPWLLVPGAAALGLAALARWRGGLVWASVALALTVWFVRPYGPGSTGAHGPVVARLDVLTSNVEFGDATDALIGAVRREGPDVVFVQECDFACADALAARVPAASYPYRDVVRLDGSLGSAILSRFPLRPAGRVDGAMAMPGAVTEVAGRDVRLQLAHPMPPVPGKVAAWRRELGRIRDLAAAVRARPAIVAGDFNASQDHAAFRAVLDAGGLHDSARLAGSSRTYSWPADRPTPLRAQIDHVLVSGEFSVRSARFLRLAATDHRALLVALELHDGG